MGSKDDSSIHVLLVEDDTVDVLHVKYGLREYNVKNTLDVVSNGTGALEQIYKQEEHNVIPKVILLDINMPKMNGFEFLKKLKLDPKFKTIPVIIVTTSNAKRDQDEAHNLQVAGYFIKPLNFEEFMPLYNQIIQS
jgi:CheY-like chemotaxis protein